ncbi:MAG: hypothetical protein NC392_12190, partial [Roseburia sp.]|nr:hypothetical protein [Roseburia sp.]
SRYSISNFLNFSHIIFSPQITICISLIILQSRSYFYCIFSVAKTEALYLAGKSKGFPFSVLKACCSVAGREKG